MNLSMIAKRKVLVNFHRTLNTVKGVITERDLLDVSDNEIVEGLSNKGIVEAKHITISRDGKVLQLSISSLHSVPLGFLSK